MGLNLDVLEKSMALKIKEFIKETYIICGFIFWVLVGIIFGREIK